MLIYFQYYCTLFVLITFCIFYFYIKNSNKLLYYLNLNDSIDYNINLDDEYINNEIISNLYYDIEEELEKKNNFMMNLKTELEKKI